MSAKKKNDLRCDVKKIVTLTPRDNTMPELKDQITHTHNNKRLELFSFLSSIADSF